MREDLERSARDDIEDPVFPYPHLKAILTPWESIQDVAGASKDDVVGRRTRNVTTSVVYAATTRVSWFPRCSGYGGTCPPVFAGTRSDTHTWSGGEEPIKPTVSTV